MQCSHDPNVKKKTPQKKKKLHKKKKFFLERARNNRFSRTFHSCQRSPWSHNWLRHRYCFIGVIADVSMIPHNINLTYRFLHWGEAEWAHRMTGGERWRDSCLFERWCHQMVGTFPRRHIAQIYFSLHVTLWSWKALWCGVSVRFKNTFAQKCRLPFSQMVISRHTQMQEITHTHSWPTLTCATGTALSLKDMRVIHMALWVILWIHGHYISALTCSLWARQRERTWTHGRAPSLFHRQMACSQQPSTEHETHDKTCN